MEDALSLLTEFVTTLKEDILDYYNATYLYLKDLISYKNIALDKVISTENDETIRESIERMVKAIKTGLNTIGVSMKTLSMTQNDFMNTIRNQKAHLQSYQSYFNLYKEFYLDKILFEILIEYLIDVDKKKIETLNLFELIPQNFLTRLNNFKEKYLTTKKAKELLKEKNLDSLVDFTSASIKKDTGKPVTLSKINAKISEGKISSEPDILTQLRTAKEDIIETLKVKKKRIAKPLNNSLDKSFIKSSDIRIHYHKPSVHLRKTDKDMKTFLEYFGNFPSIHPHVINYFKININNLLNLKMINPDFIDLECLFFYISNLKMLNLDFPFTSNQILDIIKNYVNNNVFSSSNIDAPDPLNNFYGLSIISELNLLNNISIIDLFKIERFVKSELTPFIPEKLEINFYSLLCLKLLGKFDIIEDIKTPLLNSLLNLKLASLDIFKPVLDIFHKLTSLKLIDDALNISRIAEPYVAELKRILASKQTKNDLITTKAISLLIFDLLGLKEQESLLCNQLLNSIMNSTHFFNLEKPIKEFNWRSDGLAYKIELSLLFYALFASSRYSSIISETL